MADQSSKIMKTTFHGGYDETVLFEFWKISTDGHLLASVIVVFLMALGCEWLKYFRQFRAVRPPKDKSSPSDKPAIVQSTKRRKILWYLIHFLLYITQVGVSHLLMLISMTFNGWLFSAVVLGEATGYLLRLKKKVVENCQ